MDVRSRRPLSGRTLRLALGGLGAMAAVAVLAGPLAAPSLATTDTYVTSGSYTFKVPANVTTLTIHAAAASGGSCNIFSPSTGGEGANVAATLPVNPGTKLYVGVGESGGGCGETSSSGGIPGGAGGFGGGAAGGAIDANDCCWSGAGGGGASGVGLTSLAAGTSPLVVAGGGGGAAICATNGGNAGEPGSPNPGCFDEAYGTPAGPGGAGSDTSGGAGGAAGGTSSGPGASGTAGLGGVGGFGSTTDEAGAGGGGGGGGYYGGGGGGGGAFCCTETTGPAAGGGGGSSFVRSDATGVSQSLTSSIPSVTITYTAQPKPKATTKKATGVKRTSATLHGSVNPEGLKTTYYFQFGTSKSYGRSTSGHTLKAGKSARNVSAVIHGLKPGTTYHFRVVARNASGTARGRDLTFKTSGAAAATTAPAFTG